MAVNAGATNPSIAERARAVRAALPFGIVLLVSVAYSAVADEAKSQAEKPALKFASGETSLKTEISTAALRLRLRVDATGKDEVKGVTLEVPELSDTGGKMVPVACKIQGKPCSQSAAIPGFSSALVELSADLVSPGEYTTWVILRFPGGAQALQLTVTRKLRSTATFSALGVEPGADGILWVTVADIAGMATKLRLPTVAALTISEPNRPKVQANFDKLTAFTENGKPLPDPFDLPSDTSQRIKLKFAGLKPGNYEGKLILGSLDSGRQEVPISLSQRLSLGFALLVIAVGVVISHFLRGWAGTRRPLLIKRQDLLAVREAYEVLVIELEARDALDRHVVAAIRSALLELDGEFAEGTLPVDFDTTLNRIKTKLQVLPAWIGVRRRLQNLEPAKLRGAFQKTLEDGQAYLLATRASASEDQLIASVMGLDALVSEALRTELRAQLTALRTEVETSINDARYDALRTHLQETVRPAMDVVEKRIENNDPSAGLGLDAARVEYAKALAEDLVATLDGPPPAPFATDATTDEWTQFRGRVSTLLAAMRDVPSGEAQRAIEAYEFAYQEYLRGLVGKAMQLVSDQEKIVDTISDASQKAVLKSRLDALRKRFAEVNTKARDRQLREGALAWEEAWDEYSKIGEELAALGGAKMRNMIGVGKAIGALSVGSTLPEGVTDRLEQVPQAPAVDARGDRKRLEALIRRGDRIFTAIIFLIAVLLGAKVLWIDNPAWGSYGDWLIALLWGLGLHQGSAGAFEGLAGLRAKFT